MSSFRGGYTGRMLRVDLTRGSVSVEETPDPRTWLGPRGWNARVAWNEVPPGVGPYDAENRIIFSVGPLVGTHAPTAGRMTVGSISPRGYPEPMWTTASIGGYFGAELKYAGYDGIIVQGAASSPCYLLIEDDRATLEDASDLWGGGVYGTQQRLKERHSAQHQVMAIGPAGENRVRYASIIHRLTNAVGNVGFGAVLGAKGLKALVVRGTRGVPIAEPAAFMDAVAYVQSLVRAGLGYVGRLEQGYPIVACTQGCSVRCWSRISKVPDRYGTHTPVSMQTCVESCWTRGSHPEYDGVSVHGETLSVPRPPGLGDEVGRDLSNLTQDLGLTGWTYDSWYRYYGALQRLGVDEVLGEKLDLENPEWWRNWLVRVAYRQGIGDDYAEGLARFYDRHEVGPRYLAEFIESAGSRGHGWHREGRAMERHPSPFWEHAALLYAVSTRDMTPNTHGFFFLNMRLRGATGDADSQVPPQLARLAERLYGSAQALEPGDAYIEHVTAWHQHRSVIKDSMGVCDWVFPVVRRSFDTREEFEAAEDVYGDTGAEALLYRACTGIDLSIEEMERPIAERIVNLERCVDVRHHGRNREADEWVIPHFQWPEKTDGTHLSASADEFRALLDRYYDLRGWDRETGWPTAAKLAELGLEDVAQALLAGKRGAPARE